MDSISVSKGCFVYKNGATRAEKSNKKPAKRNGLLATSSILGKEITDQAFYKVYKETWRQLESDIHTLQERANTCTLEELVNFVVNESKCDGYENSLDVVEILPAAVLLTGINQHDHLTQFETLSTQICEKISSNVCMLQSRDCLSIKAAVENLVYNFIEAPYDDNADEDHERDHKRVRRSQCTLKALKNWYYNNFAADVEQMDCDDGEEASQKRSTKHRHPLIVILPDFECFNTAVLQDLILLLSAQRAELPFCLIVGVATAIAAVHNTLPYHVTSRMKLYIAKMQAAPVALNEMLDNIILSPRYAFHLSGKALKFLTHIFLYYDFSINGFIQGYKYCMLEHFFQGNAFALCTSYHNSMTKIQSMTHDDMETIRRLLSFRPYVESINDCRKVIAIFTDDNYLKKKLPHMLHDCHIYFLLFRIFIEFLIVLVEDLPKCPLGKYRRELYEFCLTKEIHTQTEFKECWQMLRFLSKDEFVAKISKAIKATEQFMANEIKPLELATNCEKIVNHLLSVVKEQLTKVVMAGMETPTENTSNAARTKDEQLQQLSSRHDLKEKLLQMSKKEKTVSEFTKQVQETLAFIETELIACNIKPLQHAPPLHELFFFSDVTSVRRNLIGAPRAALHMALNNPNFYLQCKCCHLDEQTQLLPSMPDLSVAYKLHLECGRMINLFDWLQAFRAVVSEDCNDENNENDRAIDPEIQARFTRAVAELQFLGYIKMSKRKTDHAMRLTW